MIDGYPLPNYQWIPLQIRQARRRHFHAILYWTILLAGVVMVALGLSYLDAKTRLIQVITVLGGLVGIAAGLAQVAGKTLRNPWENEGQK